MSVSRSGYRSSLEKDVIRDQFDLPLLRNFSQSIGDTLRYFGLPGEDCRDIMAWRPFIREVAAVERGRRNLERMESFFPKYLSDIAYQAHFGDIDDVILQGHGKLRRIGGKSTRPLVANLYDSDLDCQVWCFDIVYLDYFGPFLPEPSPQYPRARSRRPQALRRLFEQERIDGRNAWILLVTVESSDYSEDDLENLVDYLLGAKSGVSSDTQAVIDYLLEEEETQSDNVVKLVHGTLLFWSRGRQAMLISKHSQGAQLVILALVRGAWCIWLLSFGLLRLSSIIQWTRPNYSAPQF